MMLLTGILNRVSPNVKEIALVDSIFSVLSESVDTKNLLPEITKLAKMYMLAPLSTASAERSFCAKANEKLIEKWDDPRQTQQCPPTQGRRKESRAGGPTGAKRAPTTLGQQIYPRNGGHPRHFFGNIMGFASHSHINDCLFQSNIACF